MAVPSPTVQYDVIVVGAGMAGLTAAKDLVAKGRSVVVLEATDRIGGRGLTNAKGFAIPIDYGGAWVLGVDTNPLTPIIDKMGFHRADTDLDAHIFIGGRRATKKEVRQYEETLEKFEAAIGLATANGNDPSAAELLPKDAPFRDLVAANIGPFESGTELERTSALDTAQFGSGNDDFVREGFGSFVVAYGKDVPVRLNSTVTKVDYRPTGATVEVAGGEQFTGRSVLVTVSTGVLSAGKIAFSPPLPDWKRAAIAGLPMGLLDKVVLEFKRDIFESEKPSTWVLYDGPGTDDIAFVVKPMGAPMAVAFYGGKQAAAFEDQGETAATAHAKDALKKKYGARVESEFSHSAFTSWGKTQWTLGSYSAALPGASKMHAELARPIDGVLFFAGEACGRPVFNGSFAGAYESALSASGDIHGTLTAKSN
jgi:monoamine oxidase